MDLQGAMAKEFTASKRYWSAVIALQFVLLACSVASIWMISRPKLIAIGGIMALVPPLSLVLKQLASRRYASGEKLRRHYVLQDGLGRCPGSVELLMAAADSTIVSSRGSYIIGQYFESAKEVGYGRLAEITEESAFYTRKLASIAAVIACTFALLGTTTAVGVLWWEIQNPASPGGPAERAARLFTQFVAFFAAGFFVEAALSYSSLARAAERVFADCDALRRSEAPNPVDVFLAVDDYNSALAKSLPLPSTIKRLWGHRLAEAWTNHRG